MSRKLKIKSKHLAEEAKIIKFEENKVLDRVYELTQLQKPTDELMNEFYSLHTHRVLDVRNEARATFLARAFLKGYNYSYIEPNGRRKETEFVFSSNVLPRVLAMANKYGSNKYSIEDIKNWSKLPEEEKEAQAA